MNVHAKCRHIKVFWKGGTHFVMTFVLQVKLTHIGFLNSLKYQLNCLFLLEIWCIFFIWGHECTCKVSTHKGVLERRYTFCYDFCVAGQIDPHSIF